MHFCCSHYISSCFLSTSPFHSLSLSLAFSFSLSLSLSLFLSLSLSLFLSLSLSLSLFISAPCFSLWLQDTCHLMPFTKYSLLDQSYFFTPYLSIAHIKFTNYSPTIFYDYHPQSHGQFLLCHLQRAPKQSLGDRGSKLILRQKVSSSISVLGLPSQSNLQAFKSRRMHLKFETNRNE